MPSTSTRGSRGDALGGQSVRCVRCTHLGDDGRRLARDHHTAPRPRPLRSDALRLAPGPIRICRLHDPAFVNRPPDHRVARAMSDAEIKGKREASTGGHTPPSKPSPPRPATETADVSRRPTTAALLRRTVSLLITLASVALSVVLGQAMWRAYVESPWTRDGTVRAYVVTMAPEISGRIVQLRVTDNQFVHKGDLL